MPIICDSQISADNIGQPIYWSGPILLEIKACMTVSKSGFDIKSLIIVIFLNGRTLIL